MRIQEVKKHEAIVHELPERDWLHYFGPELNGSKNMSLGFSVFPPGAAPEGHIHPTQEEIIFITAGSGELVTPTGTAKLEPGTAVYIPIGLHHATVSNGTVPLEMVTVFSPPVIPGSYENPTITGLEQSE